MSQDGYTLAEALAALLMIGLAIAGLTEGARVVGRLQLAAGRNVAQERLERVANVELRRLLQGQGPFQAEARPAFTGSGSAFSFDCGSGATCGARLARDGEATRLTVTHVGGRKVSILLAAQAAQFEYAGASGAASVWPPAERERRPLRAVTLLAMDRDGARPIAEARLWAEQPADCEYDMISADCRRRVP